MSQTTGVNYKKTLNLPHTAFPMRANLSQNEPQSLRRWREGDLYRRVLDSREAAGAERFVFHDGPPYANGLIHVGHLLNKVLKDFVVRSRLMAGLLCPYVPGWDYHGLPIEHKVMKDLVDSGKIRKLETLDDAARCMAIRRACRADAEKYQKLQAGQFERLLTLADYDDPYLTMTPDYERAVLEVFAELVEQGLVYRTRKSVHWSIENETALAEAELEYVDRTDTAVYVDFEAADRDAVAAAFGVELDQTPSFMIWTTTPWTLPANLAIAVHDRIRYALIRVDGNVTVLAANLVERVTQAAGSTSVEVLGEADGDRLVGLAFSHPFCGRQGPIVAADYVTIEDGTGLVHTAPGHGAEDNQTALREGLDVYCPVRADGTYDDTVPDWLRGVSIWDANRLVVDRLRESGHLFHDHPFEHSYPHDWRSKTPVIFRATEQWFVGVDRPMRDRGKTLRDLALEVTESDVRFVPEWGRNRMRGMLESRPDWCISRQRVWGLPIPAFETPDGAVLLTAASVRAVARVVGERGSDAWFTEPPETLLAGYDAAGDPDAPEAVRAGAVPPSAIVKMRDIFDVWFESGSSWNAVMRQHGRGYPVDLYLEGSDQHRGWFQLSLLPGLGVTGRCPFAEVLTHGFVVDKNGHKMSKSVGNTIEVEDVLKDFGAEVCRWWASSLAYENDIKMDVEFLASAGETYRKVRNTLRFLLGNVADLDPAAMADPASFAPESLDAYVLERARAVQAEVVEGYERYAFRRVNQLLYDFCNETLSAFYCAAVKDRLYCDPADSPRRRATQSVMWHLLEMLTRLLAPILPHTADEAYRAMPGRSGDEAATVHLETHVELPDVAARPEWARVMQVRDAALKTLEEAKGTVFENPLDAELVLPDPDGLLERFEPDLADSLGVSRVRLERNATAASVVDLRGEPRCDRCWMRTIDTRPRGDGGTLCGRCAGAVGVS